MEWWVTQRFGDGKPESALQRSAMLAAIRSAAVTGVEAYGVTVEVDATRGLPQWTVVGLAAGAVREAKERVASALGNAGFELPARRFTINLAPADQRKDGTAFDLPIALGVLVATGHLEPRSVQGVVALGELGLDGSLREVRGVLPIALHLAKAIAEGGPPPPLLVVPPGNAVEARIVSRLPSVAPSTLGELVSALRSGTPHTSLSAPAPPAREGVDARSGDERLDLRDVVGQETAKRALEIAAAGGHALLLVGPPGGGKTMLARRLAGILPRLSEEEALEVLAVQSVAGLLSPSMADRTEGGLRLERPFRAPHHTLSAAALIGGGPFPRPGEVSLAHLGVLFLDELQEIPRSVLDALRQPMEDGRVVISRAQQTLTFPARFALVGAMNPCPCGQAGQEGRICRCAPADVQRHRARISGPLADRLDMTVLLPAVSIAVLGAGDAAVHRGAGDSSAVVRARVERAREVQRARYRRLRRVTCNAHVPGRWLDAHGALDGDARRELTSAAERMGLSARGYHRVLRVARTIADLDGVEGIAAHHVAEALFVRTPDNLQRGDAGG